MSPIIASGNPLFTSPSANLNPEQDALRWRAVMDRIKALEDALRRAVTFNALSAPGGSQIASQTINAQVLNIGPVGASTPAAMQLTSTVSGSTAIPIISVPPASIELEVTPQLAVTNTRDTPVAAVIINDQQLARDAGDAIQTYSEMTWVLGGTMRMDLFNTLTIPGGLATGTGISRRAGIQWGGSGNWGVDVSFFARYHNAPTSVTLTTITDSLNGGTKSATTIDAFGFMVQVVGTAGGGFTLNRWTASGGN